MVEMVLNTSLQNLLINSSSCVLSISTWQNRGIIKIWLLCKFLRTKEVPLLSYQIRSFYYNRDRLWLGRGRVNQSNVSLKHPKSLKYFFHICLMKGKRTDFTFYLMRVIMRAYSFLQHRKEVPDEVKVLLQEFRWSIKKQRWICKVHLLSWLHGGTGKRDHRLFFFFLIGIHAMQDWTASKGHGITRKKNTRGLEHTGNLFRKSLQLKDVC